MGKKIFIVRKLDQVQDLQKIAKQKFRVETLKNHQFSYFDKTNDRIYIEENEDLLLAYELLGKDLKIHINKEP